MRMLILLAFALPAVSSAAPRYDRSPLPSASPLRNADCASADVIWADKKSEARPRRLGDLPPGALSLGVMREVDGCIVPTIIRHGYGTQPQLKRRPVR